MPPPSKKRKTDPKIAEISFDLSARQEYLTGFHKRKVQRTKQAQEAAARRAREDRIDARKKIREERKADLERHVRELDKLMGMQGNGEDDGEWEDAEGENVEWGGLEDSTPPPIDHEAEYIDEDKYTTVTVESMDATRDGLARLADDSDADTNPDEEVGDKAKVKTRGRPHEEKKKVKSAAEKKRSLQSKLLKRKKRSFTYESKIDRKVSRMKERRKNSEQAKARRAG